MTPPSSVESGGNAFQQLLQQTTPGELKSRVTGKLVVDSGNVRFIADIVAHGAPESERLNDEDKANAQRLAISWNEFPKALRLMERMLAYGRFHSVSEEAENIAADAVEFIRDINTVAASGKGKVGE